MEEHNSRMLVYRHLKDLAVYRMAKVQRMPFDRIGVRVKKSRSWAHEHTMPAEHVNNIIQMYAAAEEQHRTAFLDQPVAEYARDPSGNVLDFAPAAQDARRAHYSAARLSIVFRRLRTWLAGTAAAAIPAYVAVRAVVDSYTTAVQTALMSNGALMPLPGMESLGGVGVTSFGAASAGSGSAHAAGPVATAVGKFMSGAVITVQAATGVSAPAATVAIATVGAGAGAPAVLAVEDAVGQAAKPLVMALGWQDKTAPAGEPSSHTPIEDDLPPAGPRRCRTPPRTPPRLVGSPPSRTRHPCRARLPPSPPPPADADGPDRIGDPAVVAHHGAHDDLDRHHEAGSHRDQRGAADHAADAAADHAAGDSDERPYEGADAGPLRPAHEPADARPEAHPERAAASAD
ncbi:hypothetical protein [Nonomuraea recticatena]|uniref:hypothetical protein n=1 Tax=Nonomuraea recticatena TaxID=46178 RepID=UPI003607D4E3